MSGRSVGGLALCLCLLLSSLPSAAAPAIPPEVLSAMEPAVVGGQRPRIVHLQRQSLFQLREQPHPDADLVSLDLDPAVLSSTELEVLRHWLAKGLLPVLLHGEAIERFASLFGLIPGQRLDELAGYRLHPPLSHDCERVTFGSEVGFFQRHFYFEVPPPGLLSLAEDFQGRSVCGKFEHGKTTVFFCNAMNGPDAPRCTLNFRHWVLDFHVPASATTLKAHP